MDRTGQRVGAGLRIRDRVADMPCDLAVEAIRKNHYPEN